MRLRTKLLNVELRTCGCGLRKLKFGCGFADCGLKKKLAVPSSGHFIKLEQCTSTWVELRRPKFVIRSIQNIILFVGSSEMRTEDRSGVLEIRRFGLRITGWKPWHTGVALVGGTILGAIAIGGSVYLAGMLINGIWHLGSETLCTVRKLLRWLHLLVQFCLVLVVEVSNWLFSPKIRSQNKK